MLILWIFIGALCGWIAALLARTNKSFNVSFYLVTGIVGALLGGILAQIYLSESVDFNPNSLFIALLVSGCMLVFAKILMRRV